MFIFSSVKLCKKKKESLIKDEIGGKHVAISPCLGIN